MAMRPYPRIPLRERLLYSDGALHCLRRRAEGGHEAVAHRLDFRAAVGLQRLPYDALVLSQDFARPGVAKAFGQGGGAVDIGEQDGHRAWRLRTAPRAHV